MGRSALGLVAASFSCAQNAFPPNVPFKDCKQVLFRTSNVGSCGVSLAFDDGSSYSTQVEITRGPGDVCCSGMFIATPGDIVVTEPDAGCADAGGAD